ncbi:MAG: TonB-dependent receptor [Gemmatimonadetes bacterium]|nr:TonB-dependent receptor [Gemmatimonadota bacterium]
MSNFYRLLLLVVFAIYSTPVLAQTNTIRGQVLDQKNKPLPGASIVLKNTRLGAVADNQGYFVIPNVPHGDHVLIASYLGYKTIEQTISVTPKQVPKIAITLIEDTPYILNEITVVEEGYASDRTTATRTNTALRDLPQSVQIINGDLVEDQGLTYLTDVLQNVSGVNPFSEYLDFNMRGFRTTGDGAVKQNGLNQVHGFFNRMRLDDVERVEVVKGPAGALYGQSRPGGFINVITKQPSARQKNELKLTLGSYSKSQANFSSTGPVPVTPGFGKLLYKVNVNHANDDGYRQHEQFIYSSFNGGFIWLPTDRTSISINGEWFDELNKGHRNRGVPFFNHELVELPLDYTVNEPDDFISIEAYVYRLRADHRFSDHLKFDVSASYLTNQRRQEYHEPRGLLADGETMLREFRDQYREKQQRAVNANLIYDINAASINHTVLSGVEYTLTEGLYRFATARDASRGGPVPNINIFNPVFAQANNPLKYSYYGVDIPRGISQLTTRLNNRISAFGFYLQDQIALGNKLNVLIGARYDSFEDKAEEGSNNRASDSQWSLRGGAVFKLIPSISTYLSYSQGFEPVRSSYTFDPDRYGGPFDPENSWTIEGGAKSSFLDNRFNTTLALYHITKENVILRDPNPPEDMPDRRVQVGEIQSQGFELDMAGIITDRWSVHGSFARSLKAEITKDTNPDNVGKKNPNNPKNTIGFWSRYDMPLSPASQIGFALGGSYLSERTTFQTDDNLPSYFVVNGGIFIRYDRFKIAVNLHNLTGKEYFPGGYGGRIGGFRGTPRSFDTTVRYQF